jgi:hypothetical protein
MHMLVAVKLAKQTSTRPGVRPGQQAHEVDKATTVDSTAATLETPFDCIQVQLQAGFLDISKW